MTWDDPFGATASADARVASIELVGTHLRLKGSVTLGRFGRLTDLINASSGYLRVHDAQLLQPDGAPTSLVLAEIMVDQDEISLIAEQDGKAPEPGSAGGFVEPMFGDASERRKPREFVIFTPGHTVTGKIHIFGQTDLAGFVDATDPRFVPATDVTARSLADERIVSHYDFVLINRTQMIAAAEIGHPGEIAAEDAQGL
jgi:hypothetical protein